MIDDRIANGEAEKSSEFGLDRLGEDHETVRPLNLFTALRTDYSLHRLQHYTGTKAADFQSFILFTNYHRYMEKFVDLALERLEKDDFYEELVAPGGGPRPKGNAERKGDYPPVRARQVPNARLPPDRQKRARHHSHQHRGRSFQLEDHHRSRWPFCAHIAGS